MTPRPPSNIPDDPMDSFDRRLTRFLDMEVGAIDGAPSRSEMIERLAARTGDRAGIFRSPLASQPTVRFLIVLGLVAALLGVAFAAGTWWAERSLQFRGDLPLLLAGPIEPDRYRVTENTNLPYALTVPDGWTLDGGGFIGKGDFLTGTGVALTTWLVTHVYRDACQWTGPAEPVNSANSLAVALEGQLGHATSVPTVVRFGGYLATRLEVSVPTGFDKAACLQGRIHLWPDPGPDPNGGLSVNPGQTITIYVLDDPTMTVFLTVVRDGAASSDLDELAGLVESVRFAQP